AVQQQQQQQQQQQPWWEGAPWRRAWLQRACQQQGRQEVGEVAVGGLEGSGGEAEEGRQGVQEAGDGEGEEFRGGLGSGGSGGSSQYIYPGDASTAHELPVSPASGLSPRGPGAGSQELAEGGGSLMQSVLASVSAASGEGEEGAAGQGSAGLGPCSMADLVPSLTSCPPLALGAAQGPASNPLQSLSQEALAEQLCGLVPFVSPSNRGSTHLSQQPGQQRGVGQPGQQQAGQSSHLSAQLPGASFADVVSAAGEMGPGQESGQLPSAGLPGELHNRPGAGLRECHVLLGGGGVAADGGQPGALDAAFGAGPADQHPYPGPLMHTDTTEADSKASAARGQSSCDTSFAGSTHESTSLEMASQCNGDSSSYNDHVQDASLVHELTDSPAAGLGSQIPRQPFPVDDQQLVEQAAAFVPFVTEELPPSTRVAYLSPPADAGLSGGWEALDAPAGLEQGGMSSSMSGSGSGPESESESGSESESEAKSEAKSQAGLESRPESEAETEAGPECEPEAGSESGVEAEAEPEAEPGATGGLAGLKARGSPQRPPSSPSLGRPGQLGGQHLSLLSGTLPLPLPLQPGGTDQGESLALSQALRDGLAATQGLVDSSRGQAVGGVLARELVRGAEGEDVQVEAGEQLGGGMVEAGEQLQDSQAEAAGQLPATNLFGYTPDQM
ncbi:hypothetical protein QJQ45_023063, partial [Haematococcus lacustris]